MRTWRRTPIDKRCGFCGQTIPAGAPLLELMAPLWKVPQIRCPLCVDDEVPLDLPALVVPAPVPFAPLLPIPTGREYLPLDYKSGGIDWGSGRDRTVVVDYKSAAAGDRDPGEEG